MSGDWEDIDKAVLSKRAEILAQPRADVEAVVETVAILRFSLMAQDYAVPLDVVAILTPHFDDPQSLQIRQPSW